jgi:hypothetical protein
MFISFSCWEPFFWEPFEFGAVEITAVSNEKARVGKVLEAKLKQETFNQLECCQCGGPPHLLNSNRECRHLFCTKCVSQIENVAIYFVPSNACTINLSATRAAP